MTSGRPVATSLLPLFLIARYPEAAEGPCSGLHPGADRHPPRMFSAVSRKYTSLYQGVSCCTPPQPTSSCDTVAAMEFRAQSTTSAPALPIRVLSTHANAPTTPNPRQSALLTHFIPGPPQQKKVVFSKRTKAKTRKLLMPRPPLAPSSFSGRLPTPRQSRTGAGHAHPASLIFPNEPNPSPANPWTPDPVLSGSSARQAPFMGATAFHPCQFAPRVNL